MVKVTGLLLATQITWLYVLKDLAFRYQDEKEYPCQKVFVGL